MSSIRWIPCGLMALVVVSSGGCMCGMGDIEIGCTYSDSSPRCGDGVQQVSEECDPGHCFARQDCEYLSDTRPDACRTDCRQHRCGDDVVDSDEGCEPRVPTPTCVELGGTGDRPTCKADCQLDLSPCQLCGNGRREDPEACDGQDLGGQDCPSLGFESGHLGCTAACAFDLSRCVGCGNGLAEPYESCDGSDLKRATCEAAGYTAGVLACAPDCQIDESGCWLCPDGRCEAAAGEAASSCPLDCAWRSVDVGPATLCGVRNDGRAHCWGYSGSGALGNGDPSGPEVCPAGPCSTRPLPVALPVDVSTVAVGGGHACALLSDGGVYCWGRNDRGQLGDGVAHLETCESGGECSSTPVPVSDATSVSAIGLGEAHGCALRAGGTLACWGGNDDGQLGDGTLDSSRLPVPVLGLVDVRVLVVGGGHGCALLADATVSCWGRNDRGQLGSGDLLGPELCATGACSSLALPVIGLFDASALAAGPAHTCALRLDGTVWCWGDNDQGQLGDGTTTAHAMPVEVTGLPAVRSLALSSYATCAVDLGGTVWCWGALSALPVTWPGPGPVDAISVGEGVDCAVDPDEALWCWGEGASGQLGTGSTEDATAPARVE